MITRNLASTLAHSIDSFPVVALLGPRQVGKTTLALQIAKARNATTPALYLDLERPSDVARLSEPEIFLTAQAGRLIILDEVQRMAGLFPLLRSLVDERRRAGETSGQFLLLGSASPALLRQSSESLAGRIATLELRPFQCSEVAANEVAAMDRLWLRGGFPDSFLARTDARSFEWREQFIATYLERDIPLLNPRLSTPLIRRLWMMLAHHQGSALNAATLAAGLGVTGKTVSTYIDLLVELFLARRLDPWYRNAGKRLTKAPRIYVRDTGLLHALAGIGDSHTLLGHPLCGPSWEGIAVEHLITAAPTSWRPYYYRTAAGAELDLVFERPDGSTLAIEIKRSLQPKLTHGFRIACTDIAAVERYFVIPSGDAYPLDAETTAISLFELTTRLRERW